MKLIGLTQRVVFCPDYKESRDALDQRWIKLLHELGYTPYPIPNNTQVIPEIITLPLQGIIFTGGNIISKDALERDLVETALLNHCIKNKVPVLGVCGGMQLILTHFGSKIQTVTDHVNTKHLIEFQGKKISVNSYHHYGALEVEKPLEVVSLCQDGVVEAVRHQWLPIEAIMWHPEREEPFNPVNKELISRLFASKASEFKGLCLQQL